VPALGVLAEELLHDPTNLARAALARYPIRLAGAEAVILVVAGRELRGGWR
jgi:hypothetical protein